MLLVPPKTTSPLKTNLLEDKLVENLVVPAVMKILLRILTLVFCPSMLAVPLIVISPDPSADGRFAPTESFPPTKLIAPV